MYGYVLLYHELNMNDYILPNIIIYYHLSMFKNDE